MFTLKQLAQLQRIMLRVAATDGFDRIHGQTSIRSADALKSDAIGTYDCNFVTASKAQFVEPFVA